MSKLAAATLTDADLETFMKTPATLWESVRSCAVNEVIAGALLAPQKRSFTNEIHERRQGLCLARHNEWQS